MFMRCVLVATFSLAIALVPNLGLVRAGDDKPGVVDVLKAKDFWDKAGKKDGRKWTDAEQKQLEDLKSSSKEAVVRLRANKVLVDLAGKSRYEAQDEALVAAGFQYLEGKLNEAEVKELCAEKGFTGYALEQPLKRFKFLVVERVEKEGKSGGLFLLWDTDTNVIMDMQFWTAAPQEKKDGKRPAYGYGASGRYPAPKK